MSTEQNKAEADAKGLLKGLGIRWTPTYEGPSDMVNNTQGRWIRGWLLIAPLDYPVKDSKLCDDGEPHEPKFTVPVAGAGMVSICKHCGRTL